jgi:hypothetical protein
MRKIGSRLVMLFAVLGIPVLGSADAAAQNSNGTISVGPQPCAAVAQLKETPGAAYTPGVDARGNEVAPADLPNGGNPDLATSLTKPPVKITASLLGKFGIPANGNPFHGRAEIGYVTVRDGKAYLDGQPLSPSETAVLGDACREKR